MKLSELLGDKYTEGMTVEEIEAALENVESVDKEAEAKLRRYKAAIDKATHEAAENKRKLRAQLSEEEQRIIADKEAREQLEAEHKALLRKVTVSEHIAKMLELGYDAPTAAETAEALVDGDMNKVFANQKKVLEARDKAAKTAMLDNTPKPPSGGSGNTSYEKQLEAAQASGNLVELAYYTRLVQEEKGGITNGSST